MEQLANKSIDSSYSLGDQYVSSVPVWSAQCDDIGAGPNSASATDGMLESAIHQHQSQYELMCLNYTEVW